LPVTRKPCNTSWMLGVAPAKKTKRKHNRQLKKPMRIPMTEQVKAWYVVPAKKGQ